MANKEMFTPTEVAGAIRNAKGFVSIAAKHLGCAISTIYEYMNRHPEVADAKNEAREAMKDMAEGELFRQIQDGNTTALIFYLKCQAKDRGYIDRQEITGNMTITWKDIIYATADKEDSE